MCGITGYINNNGVRESDIQSMNDALRHRGPDDEGMFVDSTVGFGHRRLSIIDLDGGSQPMTNEDGTIWITFNGEIYNFQDIRDELAERHEFRTRSDTEVILHLYEEKGEECLADLRGMFAFAIYDFRVGKLFLARDHLGQKPLYYFEGDGVFAFASEIKSLLALKPELSELDNDALYEYLTIRIITPPRSMFKRIRKLPPAHYLTYAEGRAEIRRYWNLFFEPKRRGSFEDISEELEGYIEDTVKYHLVSDVPVGAFLSGGLDSSLVVAMMAKFIDGSFKTFSGDVPYKDHSEIPYARMASEKFNTESFELTFVPSLTRTLPEIVWNLDEPSDPFSICMYYIAELARKEVKVVLGGDGGDELFGGYDRYYGNVYASYLALLPESLRRTVLSKVLDRIPEGFWYRSLSHKMKWLNYISFFKGGERYSKSLSYFYFSDKFNGELYTESFKRGVQLFNPEAAVKAYFDSDNATELIDRMLHADYMTRLPDHPVMILDRMTMAHGLEARSPFLDHRLTEFCARIDPKHKIRGTQLRFIQVELAKKHLPSPIITRPKQGFASPLAYLLDEEFKFLYRTFLADSRLVQIGFLNQSAINDILTEHLEKKTDHGQRLWLLCNLEIWYRMYMEGMSRDTLKEQLREYEK